jgi:hypothetical protein
VTAHDVGVGGGAHLGGREAAASQVDVTVLLSREAAQLGRYAPDLLSVNPFTAPGCPSSLMSQR